MVLRKTLTTALSVALPVVVATVATWSLYREPVTILVDFERGYEGGFVSGFHQRERAGTQSFRWTTGDSTIRLRYLPTGGSWDVDVRVKALPFKDEPQPTIRFSANGATAHQAPLGRGFASYRFSIPASSRMLALGIHSPTFVARDGRTLGVQVYSVELQPRGATETSSRVLSFLGAAAALFLLAALAAGLSPPVAGLAATLVASGLVYLVAQKSVRFTAYPGEVPLLALAALGFALLLRRFMARVRTTWPPLLRVVVTASFLLKGAAITYPLFVSSDAAFQANRLRDVLAGNFFPTSVTQHQPPFLIPYPVSLYVLAAPFAAWGLDPERVLEWTTALADASVGPALFYLALRFLGDARAGILGAALYAFVPINVFAFSAGNFTNLFGAATTALFLGAFLALREEGGRPLWAFAAFALSLLTLTSHLSVFLYGMLLWPTWVLGIVLLAPPASSSRTRVVLPVVLGVVGALCYYMGYLELIAGQVSRLAAREYATGEAAVTGPLTKLTFNFPFYREWLGEVFAIVALLGAASLVRNLRRSALHVAVAGWFAVTAAFLALDLFTSLEIRYVLQATPLFALSGGHYLSRALDRGRIGRIAAGAVVLYVVALGLSHYRDCLIYRYH